MKELTESYMLSAECWLLITTLIYFLINGAQIFETVVLIPKWTKAPPKTFSLFRGENGIDLKTFWIVTHSIHELSFILALVFSWEIVFVRNMLLILFAIHFAVRAWTILYFAPTLIDFQAIANGKVADTSLERRTLIWRKLNYLRVSIFLIVSIALVPLCVYVFHLRS